MIDAVDFDGNAVLLLSGITSNHGWKRSRHISKDGPYHGRHKQDAWYE